MMLSSYLEVERPRTKRILTSVWYYYFVINKSELFHQTTRVVMRLTHTKIDRYRYSDPIFRRNMKDTINQKPH